MNSEVLANEVFKSQLIDNNDEILNRIGQVTRTLHESLRSLGLEKILEHFAKDIPDACERLNYVSRMTEQAAERVLNATDLAIPIQTEVANKSKLLTQEWQNITQTNSLRSEYNDAVRNTISHLKLTEKHSIETKKLLMEIMMAQDFQDLTGQVIKKVIGLTQNLENQLLQVLIDYSPTNTDKTQITNNHLINGPQFKNHSAESFSNQQDVDDLLNDLGF